MAIDRSLIAGSVAVVIGGAIAFVAWGVTESPAATAMPLAVGHGAGLAIFQSRWLRARRPDTDRSRVAPAVAWLAAALLAYLGFLVGWPASDPWWIDAVTVRRPPDGFMQFLRLLGLLGGVGGFLWTIVASSQRLRVAVAWRALLAGAGWALVVPFSAGIAFFGWYLGLAFLGPVGLVVGLVVAAAISALFLGGFGGALNDLAVRLAD